MSQSIMQNGGNADSPVILLVYEDAGESAALVSRLARAGSGDVLTCPLKRAASGLVEDVQPDLILLEASANVDALVAACQNIRQVTDRPVIVLSKLTDELAITRALDSGIDDYFVLPISEREFVARVKALSRRFQRHGSGRAQLAFGGLELCPDDQSVTVAGGVVDLSPMEYRLLSCLVAAQGNVVTHDYIMANVWGAEYVDSRQYLHLYIRYLRDKLEEDHRDPKLIISEWGIGYRLHPLPGV